MIRPEAPAPMLRRGPRPLLIHLMLAANSPASDAKSKSFAAGSSASKRSLADGESAPTGPDLELLAEIAAYRRHPYVRDLPDAALLWQEGETRLLDYGPDGGVPALFVPSLINRGTILDLTEERSLLRWLSRRGVRPMLVEWGWPGPRERGFTIADYITRRLEPALAQAARHGGGKVALMGYCMGGLLSIAAALRRPEQVGALGLIATPWDFQAADQEQAAQVADLARRFDPAIRATGTLPIDAIQLAFAGVEPGAVARKFRKFGAMPQDDEEARLFVAIEDWVNDGVPLAGPVALECLQGWYGENSPARGLWRVRGEAVRPEALTLPVLLVIPQRDRIVPPQSVAPLAACLSHARVLELPGGHVSIVAGPRAPGLLWQPLLEWLQVAALPGNAAAKRPRQGSASRTKAGRNARSRAEDC